MATKIIITDMVKTDRGDFRVQGWFLDDLHPPLAHQTKSTVFPPTPAHHVPSEAQELMESHDLLSLNAGMTMATAFSQRIDSGMEDDEEAIWEQLSRVAKNTQRVDVMRLRHRMRGATRVFGEDV